MKFQTYLAAWNYKRVSRSKKEIVKLNAHLWTLSNERVMSDQRKGLK